MGIRACYWPFKGQCTGVSERSGQVSWYNGCRREIQMSIDNLIEEAQFQIVSSAGKGGQVARLKQRLISRTPVFGAHLKCKLLHSLQRVDKSLLVGVSYRRCILQMWTDVSQVQLQE